MSTHSRVIWYLVLVHAVIAGCGGLLLWRDHRPWVLLLELSIALSLSSGIALVRTLATPKELVEIGRDWIREGDFSHSFRPRGADDLRRLIELYNHMLQRLREEKTRQEEQEILLHKVLAASPTGILTADHDGRIDTANPAACRLIGLGEDELTGHAPGELDAPLLHLIAELPRGESRLLGQSGQQRLRCSHSSFFDRGFARSFFVIEDLTHELWAAEKTAFEVLIRTMSHEINNTLGATGSILGSALAFGRSSGQEQPDELTTALQVAIDRTRHLSEFIERYAEVVRVPEPNRQRVLLPDLLERIKRVMEPDCHRHHIALELAVDESLPPVSLDVVQMEQVLVNIVRNAREAIDHDGSIRIAAGVHAARPWIAVEDDGPGLSTEARDKLFVPFFSTKSQGQGVGLTLAREILSRHGFDFVLESPPGGPTRAVITLND